MTVTAAALVVYGLLAGFWLRGLADAWLLRREDERIRRDPHWRTVEMFGREEGQE